MITKKFKFSIGTMYINSTVTEIVELQFDDDATDDEIDDQVNEVYTEWLFERNTGSYVEVKD